MGHMAVQCDCNAAGSPRMDDKSRPRENRGVAKDFKICKDRIG